MATYHLANDCESVWADKWRVEQAQMNFLCKSAGVAVPADAAKVAGSRVEGDPVLVSRLHVLEKENTRISGVVDKLQLVVKNLENRIIALESSSGKTPVPAQKAQDVSDDDDSDDDDFNLDSDDEGDKEAAEKLKARRIAEYEARKAKKPVLIAKSNIILDVKPWDDETDMKEVENAVRTITMEGLLWGASKLVAIGYGIKKLQISCVIEDDKVSTEDLEDKITSFEDLVQSVDIAAFNKV